MAERSTPKRKNVKPTETEYRAAVEPAKRFLERELYDENGRDLYSGPVAEEALANQIAPMFAGPRVIGDLSGNNRQCVDFAAHLDLSEPFDFKV